MTGKPTDRAGVLERAFDLLECFTADEPILSAAEIAPFRARSTSFVVDAMNGRGALDHTIKALDPKGRFVGSALMGLLYDHSLLALVVFSVVVQLLAVPLFWIAKQQGYPA